MYNDVLCVVVFFVLVFGLWSDVYFVDGISVVFWWTVCVRVGVWTT
jgi:hypothetical protein